MNIEEAKSLLQKEGWGLISPETYLIDMEKSFREIWDRVKNQTLISIERGYALYKAVEYLNHQANFSDFVECGVWKGGATILAAYTYMSMGQELPHLWLYDTFEGMTEPDDRDIISVSGQAVKERNPQGWWAVSLEDVQGYLEETGYPMERVHFVKGDVSETLKTCKPEKIGLLRLDTDWYASTKMEMEQLYPRLSAGGVLLIDDYGHFEGARTAVDEYFHKHHETPLLHRVDYTGRAWVKPF